MSRRQRIAIVLAGLVAATALAAWIATRPADKDRQAAARARALLEGLAGNVEFFTLDPRSRSDESKVGVPDLHGWTILSRKPVKDVANVEWIRSVLENPGTYGNRPYRCFDPGFAFRFEAPEPVDFLVCLDCNQIACFKGERRVHMLVIGSSGNARLLRIYKTLSGR